MSSDSDKQIHGEQVHGGDLDRARARFGGAPQEWLDLSTGVNAAPYPAPPPPLETLTRLPDHRLSRQAEEAARNAYGAPGDVDVIATAGAQAAIDALPRLREPGRAAILGPTYSEHAIALRRAGWAIQEIVTPDDANDAEALVIVNPNNPTGRLFRPDAVRAMLRPDRLLIIDESFADVAPEVSIAADAGRGGVIVLRSFGKFYGLAGLRLGFALTDRETGARLRAELGPWPVSGPALWIGAQALADQEWRDRARTRLARGAERLDALAQQAGWALIGGCDLFRSYECGDAASVQARLAEHRIWTRRFEYETGWLRLGLPGDAAGWARLEAALRL